MPPPTLRDDALARRVQARCEGLLATTVELRERYRWSLARIANALDVPGELALVRRCAALAPDERRCRVVCTRCRWSALRPRHTATLRPCPRCGRAVGRGRLRGGRPPVAERLGVEATVLVAGYVSPAAWARLRAVGGSRSAEVAGAVLERWAQGLGIDAGWRPPLGKAKRRNRDLPPEKLLLQDDLAAE